MAVPDYQSLMLPLLQLAEKKGSELSTSEAVDVLAKELGLTDEDLKEMLPSGTATFLNRVSWAATYMKKAGLLEAIRRGYYRITEKGKALLRTQPKAINVRLLQQYPEFLEFQKLKGTRIKETSTETKETLTFRRQLPRKHWKLHTKICVTN